MRAYQPQPYYARFPPARTTEPAEMTNNNDINVFNNNGVLSKNIAGVVTPIGDGTAYDQDLNTFNDVDFVTMHATSYVQTDTIKSGDLSVTVTMPPSSGEMVATTATQTLTGKTWYDANNTRVPLIGLIRKTALVTGDRQTILDSNETLVNDFVDVFDTDSSGPNALELGVANAYYNRLRLIKTGYWRLTAKGTVAGSAANPVYTFRIKVKDNGTASDDWVTAVEIPGGRHSVVGRDSDHSSFCFSTVYYKSATYATSHAYLYITQSNSTSANLLIPTLDEEDSFDFSAEFLYA